MKLRQVAKNFSDSAETYEESAGFQREAASVLANAIAAWHPAPAKVDSILELGCGTGFLTRELVTLFPNARIVSTDISAGMLARSRKLALEGGFAGRVEFVEAEANEALQLFAHKSELVAAGLALQWVPELSDTLSLANELLPSSARMAFSTLADGTFAVLRRAFADSGVEYPGPRLLSRGEITKAASVFTHFSVSDETHRQPHQSLRVFLREIQRIGAGNASGHPVSAAALRRVLKRFGADSFEAEYHLALCLCRKGD